MNFEIFIEAIKIGNLLILIEKFKHEYLTESDVNGHLPIHLACMGKSVDVVKYLIEHGSNIEASDTNGWRPIHHAISWNNLEIIKVLIGSGCELDCRKKQNESLLDFASLTNQKEIIDAIRKSSKNKNIARELGLKCCSNCDHRFCLLSLCLNEFESGEKLIRGHYGSIYKVQESQSNRYFAIKKISWKPLITDVDNNFQREAKFVEHNINEHRSKLTHSRIVKYFGAISVEYRIFIFMEYLPGGCLSEKISKYYRNGLPEETIFKYSHQILEGLHFLHENDIVHKHVQTDNILLDENDNCKLTNMGMGRLLETITKYTVKTKKDVTLTNEKSVKNQKVYYGVTNYMAPEIIQGEKYSDKSDIWSLGATVFEMFTGKPPFHNHKQNLVLMEIGYGAQPEYPDEKYDKYPKVVSFIDKMLLTNQNERPSAESLLHSTFFWTNSVKSSNDVLSVQSI